MSHTLTDELIDDLATFEVLKVRFEAHNDPVGVGTCVAAIERLTALLDDA